MKNVIVTGGSSGIGLEIAKLLAKDADHIVLVARNLTRLIQAKEVLITVAFSIPK